MLPFCTRDDPPALARCAIGVLRAPAVTMAGHVVSRSAEFDAPTEVTHRAVLLVSQPSDAPIEMQLREAREANTQLVLAALNAQQLQLAAEQARQQLKELMAVVAHELRNPLAPIRSAAALLVRVQPEELPRLQAIIERQVMRAVSLVGDLLDVSRVSSGKLRLERQVVDMAGVVAEAVDAGRPAMTTRAQHFDMAMPSKIGWLRANTVRIIRRQTLST